VQFSGVLFRGIFLKNLHNANKYFALVGARFSGKSVGPLFPQEENFGKISQNEI